MRPFNPVKELPEEPWEPQTFYVVNISMRQGNPFHKSLFYTGFLSNKGIPSGYSGFFNPSYEQPFVPIHYDPRILITVEKKLGKLLEKEVVPTTTKCTCQGFYRNPSCPTHGKALL